MVTDEGHRGAGAGWPALLREKIDPCDGALHYFADDDVPCECGEFANADELREWNRVGYRHPREKLPA